MEYRYPDTDALPRIVLPDADDIREATLFLPAHMPEGTKPVDRFLCEHGLTVIYDTIEDKPALLVTGFSSDQQLLTLLRKGGYAHGHAEKIITDDLVVEKGLRNLFRRNSLRLSSGLYLLAHSFSTLSGIARGGDKAQMGIGLVSGSGDIMMLAFGRKSPDDKYHELMRRMHDSMKDGNLEIPPQSPVGEEKENLSAFRHFMRDHVVALKSLSVAAGGVLTSMAGMQQKIGGRANYKKAAAGALVTAGFAAGGLIDEKKDAEFRAEEEANPGSQEHKGLITKATDAIQRKPLRLSGLLGGAANIYYLLGALDEKTQRGRTLAMGAQGGFMRRENAWIIDIAQSLTFLAANTVYSLSSKNVGGNIGKTLDEKMYAVAANMVLAQPTDQRETAIEQLAGFLAAQPDIDAAPKEAAKHIREKLVGLAGHPLLTVPVAEPKKKGWELAEKLRNIPSPFGRGL